MGFSLPANYSFTRKASYQYGWDWGPRILTVGIWKNVTVLIYNDTEIKTLRLTHDEITKNTTSVKALFQAYIINLDPLVQYSAEIVIKKTSSG